MLRSLLFPAAFLLTSAAAHAQAAPGSAADCRVRITAVPNAWMIDGFDPFGSGVAEATFSATFQNDGSGDCNFVPVFQLDQPPFGLSKGTGRPIRYALLNLTDTQDVTPRGGRTLRGVSQANTTLAAGEMRTITYKLVANTDDIPGAGTFTQVVTLEAQDSRFVAVGGTRLVLGLTVLPSARIGLSGAFTMDDGHAVVDLGELRAGPAPVPLQLRVASTGGYDIAVTSANTGRLRLGATEWFVPYSLMIGDKSVNLAGASTLSSGRSARTDEGFRRDSLPIQFVIGDVSNRRAGTYSDIISIAVTAR